MIVSLIILLDVEMVWLILKVTHQMDSILPTYTPRPFYVKVYPPSMIIFAPVI
jgi:hypothetical protein